MADSFKKYLEDAGFNLVKIPRANLAPLQLLSREKGKLERIGDIDDMFLKGDYPKPFVEYGVAVPSELRGGSDTLVKARLGAKFLSFFLKFIHGEDAAVNVGGEHQAELNYELIQPEIDEVFKIKVDAFLNHAGIIQEKGTYHERLFNGDVFIITQVLKSNGILVSGLKGNQAGLGASIPEVNQLASIDFEVHCKSGKTLEIKHKSDTKLVFAVQAAQIQYHKDSNSFRLRAAQGQTVRDESFARFYKTDDLMDI